MRACLRENGNDAVNPYKGRDLHHDKVRHDSSRAEENTIGQVTGHRAREHVRSVNAKADAHHEQPYGGKVLIVLGRFVSWEREQAWQAQDPPLPEYHWLSSP